MKKSETLVLDNNVTTKNDFRFFVCSLMRHSAKGSYLPSQFMGLTLFFYKRNRSLNIHLIIIIVPNFISKTFAKYPLVLVCDRSLSC